MKITFGQVVLKSLIYIVLMNAMLFVLCAIFDADMDPNLVTNVIVPILCAQASLWGEAKKKKKLALQNK